MKPAFPFVLVLSSALSCLAQTPYGTGFPGAGGLTPRLSCQQAWMGNANWSIDLTNAVGGGAAYFGIANAPAALSLGSGATLLLDLPTMTLFPPILLSGTPGAFGTGNFSFALPLSFAAQPPLSGLDFYWQAAVIDPASTIGLSLTNGLVAELTMPPQCFLASSVSGSTDAHAHINPLGLSPAFPIGGNTFTNNVNGAAFTEGGLDLYVTTSFGQLNRCNFASGTPVWSTVQSFAGSSGVADGNVWLDAARKRIWFLASQTGNIPSFVSVDVDPASATYGTIIYISPPLGTNLIGTWALSPSGLFAAIPSLLGGSLTLWDLNPQSPTFFMPFVSVPIPLSAASSFWVTAKVQWSPDENSIFCLLFGTGTTPNEIAHFSVGNSAFIDHNPATMAINNIGPNSSPAVVFGSGGQSLATPRDGSYLVVCGDGGGGWGGRLDIDPLNPQSISWTPITGQSFQGAQRISTNADGTMIGVAAGSPFAFKLFDTATLGFLGQVPLTPMNATTVIVWR